MVGLSFIMAAELVACFRFGERRIMMGHREKMANGDEMDALSRGKKNYSWRSRVRSAIKKQFNKRIRKGAKIDMKEKVQ